MSERPGTPTEEVKGLPLSDAVPLRPRIVNGPDCKAGKHEACSGDGWDVDIDAPAACACPCHGGGGLLADRRDIAMRMRRGEVTDVTPSL